MLALTAMLERTYIGSQSHHHYSVSINFRQDKVNKEPPYLQPKHNFRLRMDVSEMLTSTMEDAIDGERCMADKENLPQWVPSAFVEDGEHIETHTQASTANQSSARNCLMMEARQ